LVREGTEGVYGTGEGGRDGGDLMMEFITAVGIPVDGRGFSFGFLLFCGGDLGRNGLEKSWIVRYEVEVSRTNP
jgi:hypothetical protein